MSLVKMVRHCLGHVKRKMEDWMVVPYLKAASERGIYGAKIKVAFIVHEPETWDKLQPVYERMSLDDQFTPRLIIVPSFDVNLSLGTKYGYELEFFSNKYKDVICAINEHGTTIDLKSLKFDFVFYQDPYNAHYPKNIKSNQVVKYSKICYVPYGYTISENFADLIANNKAFFRNVHTFFSANKMDGLNFERMYASNIKRGLQRIRYFGYPCLERYTDVSTEFELNRITWTPRWTYDPTVGGSHFIEYKDEFVHLVDDYDDLKLLLRPHPMMFHNLVQTGRMTAEEVADYKRILTQKNIEMDINSPIDDILEKTGILITDISSIIVSYFMMGRPIIYCNCELPPSSEFAEMLEGIYVAENWKDVKKYIDELRKGNDYLKEKRCGILQRKSFNVHRNSAERILDDLKGG